MKVRIISGTYGGRTITAPSRASTHAMSERGRSALFNMIAAELPGATILDAFAGSGSLGFEALSRGAEHVTFIERDRVAARIIAENITLLRAHAQVVSTTVNNWLQTAETDGYDIIFADPPYHDPQFGSVEKLFTLLKPDALMVLSHPGKGEFPAKNGVVVVDNRSYGSLNLTLYRRERT